MSNVRRHESLRMATPTPTTPDIRWYAEVSDRRGVAVRCPHATVESCPRFYQSLSLLGEAGSTKIPLDEDERLLAFWKKSDVWPRTAEQATAVSGAEGSPFSFSQFCPEVLYERFGYFVTYLARYSDEIDRDAAYLHLKEAGTPPGHPRWNWQSATEQHYTECPVYSVLSARPIRPPTESAAPKTSEPPWWRKYIAEISTAIVVALIGTLAKCAG